MSAVRQADALVVGAGPTGLVAALSLAKAGLAVEIIDEAWRPAGHSYALALHPRSLLLLDELGVAAAAIEQRPQAPVADAARGRRGAPQPPLR